MTLGSTQPLREMSIGSVSWGDKGGRCERLTTLPPSSAVFTKSGNLNFWKSQGLSRPVTGLFYLYLYFLGKITQAQPSNCHIHTLNFSVYTFTSPGVTLK